MDKSEKENTVDQGRNELRKMIKEAIDKAKSVKSTSQEIAKNAKSIQDQGELFLRGTNYFHVQRVEDYINLWEITSKQLDTINARLTHVSPVSASADSTVSMYSSELIKADLFSFDQDNPDQAETVFALVDDFREVQNVNEEYEKAIRVINTLDLNTAWPGELPPIDLLTTAFQAYQSPVSDEIDPAGTSLIPLRDAINTLLDNLANKKPLQQKAQGKEKVTSIAMQLLRPEINPAYTDIFSSRWWYLNKTLSNAKKGNFTRDEWRKTLLDSFLFITAFLSAIDSRKFRT